MDCVTHTDNSDHSMIGTLQESNCVTHTDYSIMVHLLWLLVSSAPLALYMTRIFALGTLFNVEELLLIPYYYEEACAFVFFDSR